MEASVSRNCSDRSTTAHQQPARARRVFWIAGALSVGVLALAAWLSREHIEIVWHRLALQSSDAWRSERAAEALLELHDAARVAELVRAARRHRYTETLLPRMVETFNTAELAPALDEVQDILEGDNPFAWMAALEIVEALGEEALPVLPQLSEGYLFWESSPDFSLHHRILEIITALGPRAASARPVLRKALRSYDLEARRLARIALEKTASGESRAEPDAP